MDPGDKCLKEYMKHKPQANMTGQVPVFKFYEYFISNILHSKLLMFTTQAAAASNIIKMKCTILKNC